MDVAQQALRSAESTVDALFERMVETAVGAAQRVPGPMVASELDGQQRVELKMPDDGDRQRELVGEAFGRLVAFAPVKCRIHGVDEDPGVVRPLAERKQ